jgi:MHS family proline/betaine transporter-like MFS transporter
MKGGSMSTHVLDDKEKSSRVRKVMASSAIGHFVEWFDFAVYAYAAPVIASQFFPEFDPAAALLSTFAVYAVGFIARPVGGFLLGALGDKFGRKNILALVILLMGVSTTLIGLLPTYAAIGILAPILLVTLRMVQGLSAAGETIGSCLFVAEHSPVASRGRNVGIVYTASNLPPVVAALLVLFLTTVMSDSSYETWGWRVPFLIAAPLAFVGLWIRLRVEESPVYGEMKKAQEVEKTPIRNVFKSNRKAMVTVFSIAAVTSLGYYSLTGYFYSYMTVTIGVPSNHALISNSIALLITFLTVPISAAASDRVGRKKTLLASIGFSAVIAIPAYMLVNVGTLPAAIAAQAVLGLALGLVFGPAGVAFVEAFPAKVRYTGASISYNVAYTVFGGTAPLLATGLVTLTGVTISPAWYIVSITILAFFVLLGMKETRHLSMEV